jgi:ribosomal protein S18 acetylase RimI-like enzyme
MLTTPPYTSASDADLAAAVEQNLHALFRSMAVLPGYELVEGEQLCHHHAFPTNPMFKGVWATRLPDSLDPQAVDEIIDEVLAWYVARSAPYVFWWTGSAVRPVDLPARLAAHGLVENIHGDPGMGVELDALPATTPTPPGFSVVRAADQQALEDWRDCFCAAFEIPLFTGQAWVDATLSAGITQAPWQLYVGYLDGQPVATNMLFNGAGVASVYGVAAVPAARGRGIGAAITLQPLLHARDQGYRYGVLFSTEMGYPVYRRLGFRPLDCKIGRYILWRG